jgi:hypothetical protein
MSMQISFGEGLIKTLDISSGDLEKNISEAAKQIGLFTGQIINLTKYLPQFSRAGFSAFAGATGIGAGINIAISKLFSLGDVLLNTLRGGSQLSLFENIATASAKAAISIEKFSFIVSLLSKLEFILPFVRTLGGLLGKIFIPLQAIISLFDFSKALSNTDSIIKSLIITLIRIIPFTGK